MKSPKLTVVELAGDFSLRLHFSDGTDSTVDFKNELKDGIFEALRDPAFFRSFTFHKQFGSIEWKNGVDFAPEFLYELASKSPTGGRSANRRKSA